MKVVRTLLAAGADINNKITGSINTGCASTLAVARRQPEQTDRCVVSHRPSESMPLQRLWRLPFLDRTYAH